ncbi:hypothetical protein [Pauljensenia hongkongensis]|uniref:hypothetical protein n=1 Tax=Pauljensenia hongkongensis TaxID=178339 RepID=UPI0001F65784|nr:hypothetical protein [Pauljensenia hongkongensis]EFW09661.1 hypothetical protein HMPREF9005_1358 [Actinomyces sp. oral taxon 178 str. F0338]
MSTGGAVSGAEALDTRPSTGADTGAGASDALHGSASPSSSSSSLNPLVAGREESRSAVSGSGVVEDIWGLAHGLSEGSWLETGLSSVSLVADAVGVGVDPLGTLIAWGAGWLIDHFGPLKSWMDQFLGDADSVRADAATWSNVAWAMGECADSLEQDERGLMGEQVGATARGYRASNADTISALRTASGAADAMGKATSVLAEVVGLVHDLLRDAISAIVGTLASAIIEAIATFGLAIPLIIAQVQVKVGAKATQMAAHITGVLKSARSLAKQLSSARGLLELLRSLLSRGKRAVLGIVEFFKDGRRKARELFERITHGSKPHWDEDGATARAQELVAAGRTAHDTKVALENKFKDLIKKYGLEEDYIGKNGRLKVNKDNYATLADDIADQGATIDEIDQVLTDGSALTEARRAEKAASEELGAEFRENTGEPPRTVIPGIGGVGGGNRSFDLLAVDERVESIDFVEAKGGLHPKMGHARNILPDGSKGEVLEQGTGAYLNHIARQDKNFLQLLRDNPDLWERIKSGQVTLNNVVCKTPTADLSLIERTTEAFTLEPETIRALDTELNPPPTTNGTTP